MCGKTAQNQQLQGEEADLAAGPAEEIFFVFCRAAAGGAIQDPERVQAGVMFSQMFADIASKQNKEAWKERPLVAPE